VKYRTSRGSEDLYNLRLSVTRSSRPTTHGARPRRSPCHRRTCGQRPRRIGGLCRTSAARQRTRSRLPQEGSGYAGGTMAWMASPMGALPPPPCCPRPPASWASACTSTSVTSCWTSRRQARSSWRSPLGPWVAASWAAATARPRDLCDPSWP
jgi:hypothetical protein